MRKMSRDQWLILCLHNVVSGKARTPYDISLNDFRQLLKAIDAESQLAVTVSVGYIDQVGMESKLLFRKTDELSPGQKQWMALARSMTTSTSGTPASRSERYPLKKRRWRRAKFAVERHLRKSPTIYTALRFAWRTSVYLMFRSRMRLTDFLRNDISELDIDKTLWLPPEKIVYCSLFEFDIRKSKGAVMDGDWDCLEKRFDELDIYVAFRQVFIEGRNWIDTVFYQRTLDALKKGERPWGCVDENDLIQRCKGHERLFHRIKNEGYRTQRELIQSQKLPDLFAMDDEVTVSVGRYGDFLFSNSAHRLAIAKILGVKQIPVKIAVRHKEWIDCVTELQYYAKSQGGKLYQPATHPDLASIPTFHNCEDRFLMIKENISVKGGRLLDIGANLGYFCHRFEDEGFECYAVEESPKELYFLQKLRRAENKKFTIVAENIYSWSQVGLIDFDVVLALNVFHHALKTKQSFEKLVALLQNLRMRELFFEPPKENETKGFYRDYSPDEFVTFIMHTSKFKTVEAIGNAADGRTVYKLT